jgi:ribonuclease I
MDETKNFFLIILIISGLLISGLVLLYFIFREENIFEYYDCYVFSIFWTPTTCTTKNSGNYECFQKIKELGDDNYFTLHGLWPSLLSGIIPPNCNIGNNITPSFDNDKDFKEKLEKYWPGLYSNNSYLWMNEYNKHGFCYIKRNYLNVLDDYKIYFNKSISMFENDYRNLMEQILPDSKGVYNVSKVKFKNWLKNSKLKLVRNDTYSLICDNAIKQLSEIRFILDLNFERTKAEKSQENALMFLSLISQMKKSKQFMINMTFIYLHYLMDQLCVNYMEKDAMIY